MICLLLTSCFHKNTLKNQREDYLFNEDGISEIISEAPITDYEEAYLAQLNDFIEGGK